MCARVRFINADLIAAGLSPFAPEKELIAASRIFLSEIEERITQRQNFAFETTLAGRSYLRLVDSLNNAGWTVKLIYLALPSVEMSKLRVAERVEHGGHNIPTIDIERRFTRSLSNLLSEFSYKVDHCQCFMNDTSPPELVFEQTDTARDIIHPEHYRLLQEASS